MPANRTHNALLLRPAPGAKFMMLATGDVELQFERGKEEENYRWMERWLDSTFVPAIEMEKQRQLRIKQAAEQAQAEQAEAAHKEEMLATHEAAHVAVRSAPIAPPINEEMQALRDALAKATQENQSLKEKLEELIPTH